MKTIFTDNCPVCQVKLDCFPDEFGTLYTCSDHYTYEEKRNRTYDMVDFHIPRYMVRNYINEYTFRLFWFDEQNELYKLVGVFPAFDFDWSNLQVLSDKFKKLIVFT